MTTTHLHNEVAIKNMKDLRREIFRVKAEVNIQEMELKEHFKRFPEEALLYVGQSSIKLLVKKGVPLKLVGIIKNGIGLYMGIQKQKKGVQGAISKAKEFVAYTVFNKIISLYQKKRRANSVVPQV
jgi:hypothetical protein